MRKAPLILFFPFDLLSHYLRCLQLASALKDECRILFAHSEKYLPSIREAGFDTFPCEDFNPAEVMACSKQFRFDWINTQNLERVFLSQARAIRQFRPDLVIGDAAFALRMAAQQTRTPHISVVNGYMTKYYAETRRVPRTHPASRFAGSVPPALFAGITRFAEALAFRHVHRPYRRLRKKYALPPERMYLDELEGDRTLICDLEEIFPQKGLPASYSFIGPAFHKSGKAEDELKDLLPKGRKSILVNMGSTGDWEAVKFLNEEKYARYNIISAGDRENILNAPHINRRDFINICAILDDIDLIVCHGGNGSLLQALAGGVPVLCATSIFEQEWNVQRIEALGLGASLYGADTEESLFSLVEYWTNKKHSEALRAIRNRIDLEQSGRNFRRTVMDFLREQDGVSTHYSPPLPGR